LDTELKDILISSSQPDFTEKLGQLRSRVMQAAIFSSGDERNQKLQEILQDVGQRRDAAVAEYTEKFDKVKLTPEQFCVTKEDLQKAHKEINKELLGTIRKAIANVKKYQEEIFIGNSKTCSGGTGIKYTPIKRVGICVPGASAPLPSTVIMTAVPAQVAGVKEIAVISPPRYNGGIHPVILAVCYELKIEEVYRIGGAQAVAALACGTETIRKVNKIVGPGNQWVQAAKKEYFGFIGMDSVAGPSEVLIIADSQANPAWAAADMLSQAEHDPGSAVVFTNSLEFGEKVFAELQKQVKKLNRSKETIECLNKFGRICVFKDMAEIITRANDFAPEHLEIQCGDKSRRIAGKIENAGAIFIGRYSPVAVGDYFAGPSHTLPTGTSAKFFSALSSNDFVKSTSIIEYNAERLKAAGEDIIRLAKTEGLDAHAKSVSIRQRE